MNLVIMHLSVLKERKKYKGNYKPRRDRECMYVNEEDEYDEQAVSVSDDEIEFVEIKEESPEKVALVLRVEKKFDWIINSGCSYIRLVIFSLRRTTKICVYNLQFCCSSKLLAGKRSFVMLY